MPETFSQYSIFEVVLAGVPLQDNPGAERIKEGDIIGMRPEGAETGIGMKEGREFLWLRLTGFDDDQMKTLAELLFDPPPTDEQEQSGNLPPRYDKRRFFVDLRDLQALAPTLDLDRIRDPNDWYQPLLPSDPETGLFLEGAGVPPFEVAGLIVDKLTTQRV